MGMDITVTLMVGVPLEKIPGYEVGTKSVTIPQYDQSTGERRADRVNTVKYLYVFGKTFAYNTWGYYEGLEEFLEQQKIPHAMVNEGVASAIIGVPVGGSVKDQGFVSSSAPVKFGAIEVAWAKALEVLSVYGVTQEELKLHAAVYVSV